MAEQTATDTAPEIQEAVDSFDVVDWLNEAVNASTTITVYRDGATLRELAEAAPVLEEAEKDSKNAKAAELSIADEFDEAAQEARAIVEPLREKLQESGATFHLRSIGTTARDELIKAVSRRKDLKAVPATEDEPAVRGGREHPDFQDRYEEALIAKSIVKVVDAQGRENVALWTADKVKALRKLPANEFRRLWDKTYGLHWMQYEIDQMIDLDFSSRH